MSGKRVAKIRNNDSGKKGSVPENFQPRFQRVTEDDIAFLLQSLTRRIGRTMPVMTVKDIENLTGKSDSAVYAQVASGRLSAFDFIRIVQEAARRGSQMGLDLFNPRNYILAPLGHAILNGRIDDEIAEEVEFMGNARCALEKGEYQIALGFGEENLKAATNLVAEIREFIA